VNILKSEQAFSNGGGLFSIQMRRPGLIYQDPSREDLAFGSLARIDHARLQKGVVVGMHEHINDKILSYMYQGDMLHEDSDGTKELISPSKNMMMGAGKSFFHQESASKGNVEMLQIFIRPYAADLKPEIQFAERTIEQNGNWTLIGGPKELNAPLVIRQQIAVFDVHGNSGQDIDLPKVDGMTPWLYIMDGQVEVVGNELHKGDAVTGEASELINVTLLENSTLVLFLVDLNAQMTFAGNFSGMKK